MIKRAIAYLSVILAIFARDVKRVMRNPVALVIVLGMIAMPSAYAWYVVVANWDPYSNTAAMKVAVANEDAGYDSPEAGRLDVGRSVVDQLHDNHDMGWEFTDRESAINGVYEGKYWAALVIPEDFSEDFASVLTGALVRGSSLPEAARLAADFTALAARRTAEQDIPRREGVDFEPLLGVLGAMTAPEERGGGPR